MLEVKEQDVTLITSFLGWEKANVYWTNTGELYDEEEFEVGSENFDNYERMIFPAFIKIQSLGYTFMVACGQNSTFFKCSIYDKSNEEVVSFGKGIEGEKNNAETLANAMYLCVLEFIKKHNKIDN